MLGLLPPHLLQQLFWECELDPARHAMGTPDTMRAGHRYAENAVHRKVGGVLRPRGHLRSPLCTQRKGKPPGPGLSPDPQHRLTLTLVTP